MSASERLWLLFRSLGDNGRTVSCRGPDRELWTSEDRHDQATAARVCWTGCPALDLCADITPNFGVWAGVDHGDHPADRRTGP